MFPQVRIYGTYQGSVNLHSLSQTSNYTNITAPNYLIEINPCLVPKDIRNELPSGCQTKASLHPLRM